MICSKCGTVQREGSDFCHNCGNRVAESVPHETLTEFETSEKSENPPEKKKRNRLKPVVLVCASLVFTAAVSAGVGYKAWTEGYEQGLESYLIDPDDLEAANANAKKAYDIATAYFDELESENTGGLTMDYSSYEGSYDCTFKDDGYGLGHEFSEYFYESEIGGMVYVGWIPDGTGDKLFVQWQATDEIGENAIGQYPDEIEWEYRYFVGFGDYV
jgi:hypothetical protein